MRAVLSIEHAISDETSTDLGRPITMLRQDPWGLTKVILTVHYFNYSKDAAYLILQLSPLHSCSYFFRFTKKLN